MRLSQDSVSPTRLLSYRECPRRASYGMKDPAVPRDERTPEAGSWATAYGSAIHSVIEHLDNGSTLRDAVTQAWNEHGRRLLPEDVKALVEDGEKYVARDFPNTRTVLNEQEIRVPLMRHRGKQIYFRTRVDRLLERLDAPGTFIHIDYKSSRHPKSRAEVRDDLQMWMSNWAIHDYFPEIDELVQVYDQLRFGQVETRKNAAARKQIKEWIVHETVRMIEDEDWQDDGLLKPALNQFCSWCPILESCQVVPQLSEWALTRIATLAPQVKKGRATVIELDPAKAPEYIDRFAEAKNAIKILKRFEEAVRDLLIQLPAERRGELGYDLRPRRGRVFTTDALRAMHDQLGERFFDLVKVTKSDLESELSEEPDLLEFALGLADDVVGSEALVAIR